MAVATRMSVEEFLARDWPRGTQLIRGEVVLNAPALLHQLVLGRIYALLLAWVEAEPGRGLVGLPVAVRLDQELYVPDVWWLREERRPDLAARRLEEAPDLVVEVRSSSTWRFDVGVKRATYEDFGVAELWLVDTAAPSVLVYRRSAPSVGCGRSTSSRPVLFVEPAPCALDRPGPPRRRPGPPAGALDRRAGRPRRNRHICRFPRRPPRRPRPRIVRIV